MHFIIIISSITWEAQPILEISADRKLTKKYSCKYESVILTIYTNRRTHRQDNVVSKRTDRELDVIN